MVKVLQGISNNKITKKNLLKLAKDTDYIIAVISEEYGSLISILIILIFLYISFSSDALIMLVIKKKISNDKKYVLNLFII